MALVSVLQQTHCARMWFYTSDSLFIACFWISTEVLYLQRWHGWIQLIHTQHWGLCQGKRCILISLRLTLKLLQKPYVNKMFTNMQQLYSQWIITRKVYFQVCVTFFCITYLLYNLSPESHQSFASNNEPKPRSWTISSMHETTIQSCCF